MTERSELKFKSHILTITLIGIMAAIALPRQGGFWALVFIAFVLLYYCVKLTYLLVVKKPVKVQSINLLLWISVVSLIGFRHVALSGEAERAALKVSSGIENYHLTKGEYPVSLDKIGASDIANEYRITYAIRDGVPFLMYPVTWKYFDAYGYNFQKKVWEYQPD